MRFSIITPTAGLQQFATLSGTHLLLSHVTNELYWRFYAQLQQTRPTDLIILDNSSYEAKLDMQRALDCLHYLVPSVLVMPDQLGQSVATFGMAQFFIREYRHKLPCELMYVPQCDGSVDDFYLMLKHIRVMREMYGITWFGIPRHLAIKGISRSDVCRYIKRIGEECYVHALGMAAGSLVELGDLDNAGCDSVDSSAPVWRGWNGYGLDNREGWEQNGTECDFDAHPNSLTVDKIKLIQENLRKVGINAD